MQLSLPDPTGPFLPSPMKEVSQEEYEAMMEKDNVTAIIDEPTPDARAMPFAAGETGKSPHRQGGGIDRVDEAFQERCLKCLGILPNEIASRPRRLKRSCVQ